MAQEAVKSASITNRDATPSVLNNANSSGGMLRAAFGVCTIASDATGSGTPGSASTYRFCQLPSNAVIHSVTVTTDQAPGGGSATMDIGFYETTQNGGAILNTDGDQIAAAVDFHTAALNHLNVTYQGAEEDTVALATQMVWQNIGLSTDPNKNYDVVGTLTASNTTAAVKMLVKVTYSI